MKTIKNILQILVIITLIYSCDDENTLEKKNDKVLNLNANPTIKAEYSNIEFPHIKNNKDNIIVIHSTREYGINYSVEWDCAKKAQRWTCYQMYDANSVTNWNRSNWYNTSWKGDPFQEDIAIPQAYRTTLYQHVGDEFDRGHICASADRLCSKEANEQTYYLSNMQPQYNKFNAGIWAEMENQLRKWNKKSFRDTLYVCKGGTIDKTSQIIKTTSKGLIVPKYFFMAILCKNKEGYKALAFLIQHEDINRSGDNLAKYVKSIDELEEFTGIDFFCNLPDNVENKVEQSTTAYVWGLK